MKRKLSLLMAAVMAVSALPFTASEVGAQVIGRPGIVPNNTVFVEAEPATSALYWNAGGNAGRGNLNLPGNMATAVDGVGVQNVGHAVHAGYLELPLQGRVTAGERFRVDLANAEWFFRASNAAVNNIAPAAPSAGYISDFTMMVGGDATTANNLTVAQRLRSNNQIVTGAALNGAEAATITTPTDTFQALINRAAGLTGDVSTAAEVWGAEVSLLSTERATNSTNQPILHASSSQRVEGGDLGYHRIGQGIANSVAGFVPGTGIRPNRINATYDFRRGAFLPGTGNMANQGSYLRYGRYSNTVDLVNPSSTPRELPYVLNVSRQNPRSATIAILETAEARGTGIANDNWVIRIPLAIRLTAAESVTATVVNLGNAFVNAGVHFIVEGGGAAHTAHVVDPVTARDRFDLERLVIEEVRANSFRRTGTAGVNGTNAANAFDLVLPSGFYFDNNLDDVEMWLEGGDLMWAGGHTGYAAQTRQTNTTSRSTPNGKHNTTIGSGDYNLFFPDGYHNNRSRLRVRLNDFVESRVMASRLVMEGLTIWADENAAFGVDIEMKIENTHWIGLAEGWEISNPQGNWVAGAAPDGWWWFPGFQNVPSGWMPNPTSMIYAPSTVWHNVNTPPAGLTSANWDNVATWTAAPSWLASWSTNSAVTVDGVRRNIPFQPQGTWVAPGVEATTYPRNEVNMISPSGGLTVKAGHRADWEVRLSTVGNIPELVSGRYESATSMAHAEHQTARILFEEIVPNSWWAGRTVILNLPEEVKWRSVYFERVEGIPTAVRSAIIEKRFANVNFTQVSGNNTTGNLAGGAIASAGQGADRRVTFDGNRMFWADVLAYRQGSDANRRAEIRFDAWVSIAAHFEGDIVLTASGSSVPETVREHEGTTREGLPSTVIARAIPPVRVETNITDTRIGFQYQETADIVITETRAGNLKRDRNVRLSVTDFVSVDTLFSPDVSIEVTEANGLTIRNLGTGLAGSLYNYREGVPTLGVEANRGTLSFDIASPSNGSPATITVSNVSVRVDRNVPETNDRPYSVIVWGSAIANNFGHHDTRPLGESVLNWPIHERTNNDRFADAPGIITPYVRVVTGGDGSPWLTQEVRTSIGELYFTVNGVPYEMDVASILDPSSDSTFVPLRFIGNAFGLQDDKDIVWDPINRSVTLVLPNGRVVQFQVDSPIMLDNGAPRNITNAAGQAISPMMVTVDSDGGARMFLPFRFFGEAVLGVEVAWEAETQTAIFNPQRNNVAE